ncbi:MULTISPECIES: hypothetical protein [unclassified Rathayibacter]|uniref:hypothetical protein n=1 Tax=unclassified Rathayibacter TaxID=2609250 RepID=UPI0006FAAF66|nr:MULTISPECIES: hypothetical protein [unclassified Rathayibacter]KQQ03865.1 hypothetical protein ASF42_10420 [Rathayibacter sp. Leaf294]KQS12322.1 hypothetical protein ASG06_10420 [Rathayibacter sp. Leaf185]
MIRTTRAALSVVVPTAALALAVVFASAALAPEAATAPEPSAEAVVAATPTLTPTAESTPMPRGDDDTAPGIPCCPGADAGAEDSSVGETPAPRATGTPDAESPERIVDGEDSAESDSEPRDPEPRDADGIDVGVAIDPPAGPGALAMTVASSAAQLQEAEAGAQRREFRGALPTVTVTDTRGAGSAGWYVLASAGDFVSAAGRSTIGGDHLGWTPSLVGEPAGGRAGERVLSALDGGDGLRDAVLLAASGGPVTASATAELLLATERSIAAGAYRSTLTLSLFE